MSSTDKTVSRTQIMSRLRSGEKIAAIAADSGLSHSTLYRWRRETASVATKAHTSLRPAIPAAAIPAPAPPTPAPTPPAVPVEGYVGDMTGPGITDTWGVTCTDLGVSAVAPNGQLVSVFGDTFSARALGRATARPGRPDWRRGRE